MTTEEQKRKMVSTWAGELALKLSHGNTEIAEYALKSVQSYIATGEYAEAIYWAGVIAHKRYHGVDTD